MTQSLDPGQESLASDNNNSHKPQRTRAIVMVLIMIALPLINGVLLALGLLGVFLLGGGGWDFRFDGMNFLYWAGFALLVGMVLGLGYSVAAATWNGQRGCAIVALLICGIMELLFFCGASILIASTFMF